MGPSSDLVELLKNFRRILICLLVLHCAAVPGEKRCYSEHDYIIYNSSSGIYRIYHPTACSQAPATPDKPTYVSSTDTSITISWPIPDMHGALHLFSQVHVDNGANGAFGFLVKLTDITQSQYTATGLTAGNTYRFKVSVTSEAGQSAESQILSVVFRGPLVSRRKGFLVKALSTNSAITLTRVLPAAPLAGGSPLTGYKIDESTDGVNFGGALFTSNDLTTLKRNYTRLGCIFGKNYWFRMTTTSGVEDLPFSYIIRVRCSAPPNTPVAPTLSSSTKTSITIAYTYGNVANLNNAVLQGYTVYIDDGNGGPFLPYSVTDVTQQSYTFSGLVTSLPYRFMVQIISDAGTSAASPTATIYAAARADKLPDDSLFVSSSTANSITLAWTQPSAYDSGGAPVTNWLVWAASDGYSFSLDQASANIKTTSGTVFTGTYVPCAVANAYVFFKIAALTAAGVGQYSEGRSFRCSPKPDRPNPPTRLSSTDTSITISFAPGNLNSGMHYGYAIYVDDGWEGSYTRHFLEDTSQTTYTATGLTTALGYRFRIAVVSEVGESDPSNPATFYPVVGPTAPHYISSTISELLQTEEKAWASLKDEKEQKAYASPEEKKLALVCCFLVFGVVVYCLFLLVDKVTERLVRTISQKLPTDQHMATIATLRWRIAQADEDARRTAQKQLIAQRLAEHYVDSLEKALADARKELAGSTSGPKECAGASSSSRLSEFEQRSGSSSSSGSELSPAPSAGSAATSSPGDSASKTMREMQRQWNEAAGDNCPRCAVCLQEPACMAVAPCFHLYSCKECATKEEQRNPSGSECAMCRARVTGWQKVRWSPSVG